MGKGKRIPFLCLARPLELYATSFSFDDVSPSFSLFFRNQRKKKVNVFIPPHREELARLRFESRWARSPQPESLFPRHRRGSNPLEMLIKSSRLARLKMEIALQLFII